MKAQSTGPVLSAVFVDYDNIYLSLKRKSEDAARRFAKDAGLWLKEIESGRLFTPTNSFAQPVERRIVLNRCYGNPVPRRNASDNSTDMNSFPFVRHHFLRAGFEVIDCPPLTAQLKNSADIRMVMDVRDMLSHETRFEEFILLSGDADFTPLLHRLRAHARRTVVYANDHTAAPYTAISDGEVREADLLTLLLEGKSAAERDTAIAGTGLAAIGAQPDIEQIRREIMAEVLGAVRASSHPVPLEALADRAVRLLGHDKTIGSAWGGAGSFRDLLAKSLPMDVRLSEQAPFFVFDTSRHLASQRAEKRITARSDAQAEPPRAEPRLEARPELRPEARPEPRYEPTRDSRLDQRPAAAPITTGPAAATAPKQPSRFADQSYAAPAARAPAPTPAAPAPAAPQAGYAPPAAAYAPPPVPRAATPATPATPALAPAAPQAPAAQRASEPNAAIRNSIARIHEACQAPPLAPPEYRALFEVMADEITSNGLAGAQTLVNIMNRARELGVELRRDDIRFVLEVVSEPDPWFEQGASANLFASRFRNFVVARCRSQSLNLSSDELDLIDAWFGGSPAARPVQPSAMRQPAAPQAAPAPAYQAPPPQAAAAPAGDRWWSLDEGRNQAADVRAAAVEGLGPEDEFPRIIRSRLRG